MERDTLAALLKALRERAGLTQAQLSRRLRHSPTWVSKVENGQRGIELAEIARWGHACEATISLHVQDGLAAAPVVHPVTAVCEPDPLERTLTDVLPHLRGDERSALEALTRLLVGRAATP